MPRLADEQLEDHYQSAHNAHHTAVTRFEPGDHEYNSLMLEGLLHAVLDLGVGVAELAAQLRGQAAGGLAPHDEGTSYCTAAAPHRRDGVICR